MLDTETKRRIDTARDILVGKVPDPKSQVEQITIALIYKFMDDMDAEAEELGGKRKFFTKEFARYGWAKLMSPSLGGHEMRDLYEEALKKMPENERLPELFRKILDDASLPYRDPETLKSFLKIINEFSYDHSEKLGDAFEYLLSVLGSQGDAGQFRTPRHIIDFMVEVIAPKKGEVILDPACGTAGFLISAYKHILKSNSTLSTKSAQSTSALTPDERRKLAANIRGYDISPDMVRLSLVNLYLHGFADPHIVEYDTLTSEERWNEYADVILANPPFMSPKGGIKPHKRFSIQAKRSEVLFVDYMAEHLTPTGRAAIIVPEGIIFQSQTAYKQLRKMLVENSLVAVVSLPAGCFNPYSGVKTSILFLDRGLARSADSVVFYKIENDGYGLGAQRRAVAGSDLPEAADFLRRFLSSIPADRSDHPDLSNSTAQIVPKSKIAANGDYNLSGERYREGAAHADLKWPTVSLGEICTFMTGGTPTSTVAEYYENGTVPWLVSGDIHGFEIHDCEKRITQKAVENSNARVLPKDSVLIALNGQGKTRGTVALLRMKGATCNQSLVAITPTQPPKASAEFLFWVLRSMYTDIRALTGDTERSGLNMPILRGIQIPLPPLEIQKEIVAEIEGYQKVINGARAVLDHYRPHIPIHPDWPMVELGEIVEDMHQGINTAGLKIEFADQGIPIIQSRNITSGTLDFKNIKYMSPDDWVTYRDKYKPQINDVLFTNIGTIGKSIIVSKDEDYLIHWNIFIIKTGARLNPKYLKTYLDYLDGIQYFTNMQRGGTVQFVSKKQLSETQIALPSLAEQQAIVAEIEAEQKLVAANRELITRFEHKIQTTLARIWGE